MVIDVNERLSIVMQSFFNIKKSSDGYVNFIKHKGELEKKANSGDIEAHNELVSWGLLYEEVNGKKVYKTSVQYLTLWKSVVY